MQHSKEIDTAVVERELDRALGSVPPPYGELDRLLRWPLAVDLADALDLTADDIARSPQLIRQIAADLWELHANASPHC